MKTKFESVRSNDYVKETDWYRYETDRLCKKLNTDKDNGLDEKTLSEKMITSPKNDIFEDDPDSRGNAPKTVWPILAGLLSVLLIISGFVLKDSTSWFSLALTVSGYSAVFLILALALKAAATLEEYSIPKVTVIRGGIASRVSQRDIVQGDVVLISEGDIVPCDGRIVYENGLFVLEKNISGGTGRKDADFTDKTIGLEASRQLNMVFAGSAVSAGSCRIIACDVGDFTLCKRRGIKSKKAKSSDLELFSKAGRFSRIYSVCCTVAVFVITMLSFIKNDNSAVFSAFMLSLSIAVSSFCELIAALSYIAVVLGVYPEENKKNKSGVVVKNLSAVERMRNMTCLFIPKNPGICRSKIETELVFTNERELYIDPENAEKLRRTVYIGVSTLGGKERHAKKQTAQTTEQDAFTETAEKLGIGLSEIESSMIPLELRRGNGERLFDESLVLYKEQYMICLRGNAVQIVSRCTSKLSNGSPVRISDESRKDLIARAEAYERNAYRVTAIASKISRYNNLDNSDYCENDLCFEGFFVMREPYPASTADAVATLSSMGVKTVMFCDDMTRQSVNLAEKIGICRDETQKLTAPEFATSNINILGLKMLSYRLFCGLGNAQKKYVNDVFVENGEKLGVVGRHLYDISLMNDESTTAFAVTNIHEEKPKIDENGYYVPETSEALKRASDVLIAPADKKGKGGINAVLKAVLMSRKACNNVYNATVYLAVSNAVRFILSSVAVFSGLFVMTPAQMLFSGMVLDLFAVISVFLSDNREMSVSADLMKKAEKKPLRPVLTALTYFAAASLAVFASALPALLTGCTPAQTGVVCFAALMLTQLALCRQITRGDFGFKAGLTGLFVILVLAVAEYLALSAVFDSFFDSFMTGSTAFWGILLSLIAPAVCTVTVRLGRLIRRKK